MVEEIVLFDTGNYTELCVTVIGSHTWHSEGKSNPQIPGVHV